MKTYSIVLELNYDHNKILELKNMKNKITLITLILLTISCTPSAHQVGPNEYELSYCQDERVCFKTAEKTCKKHGGYEITKYSNHPERFVCKEEK